MRVPGRLSVAQCNAACTREGKKYSARQYKGQCFCGNGNYAKYGSSNKCGPCDSNNVGGYLSCVYEDKSFGRTSHPSNQPFSSTSPSVKPSSFTRSLPPSPIPSQTPSQKPSIQKTNMTQPSLSPTIFLTSSSPSINPSSNGSNIPSSFPTVFQTSSPSNVPFSYTPPSFSPSNRATIKPTTVSLLYFK